MRRATTRALSRLRKPADLSLDAWQRELRRQFGRQQPFTLKNTGSEPVFSDFHVSNPESASTYRVAIRGPEPGDNYCTCADFATNALGTCKHVEFVLGTLERRRTTRAALRRGFRPPYSEIVLHYGAKREVRFRPGTECPAALSALAKKYFDAGQRLRPNAFETFGTFLSKAAGLEHSLRCYDDVLGFVAEVRDRGRREQRIAAAFPRGASDLAWRGLLRSELYEYQREGALFAARAGRCLIGDEMGLGKTIQAIAAAEIMARQLGVERVLVVCPTSLKHQWEREIARFIDRKATVVGGLRTATAGGLRRRGQLLQDHELRHGAPRSGPDSIVVAGPGHPRRGPADQELEHPRGPQREADHVAVCLRADRHAAREPTGGACLDRAVRRQASSRTDLPVSGRPSDARRGRQGGRLPEPGRDRP